MEPPTWARQAVQKRPPAQPFSKVLNATAQPSPAGARRAAQPKPAQTEGPPTGAAATKRRTRPGGAMLRPWSLHGAARLFSLCLLTQCHLHALGEEARPGDASPKAGELQLRSLPGAASPEGSEEDLFPDVDPKVLAAVLLQALRTEPGQKPANGRRDPEAGADEERVRSRTQSSDVEAEREQERERGWDAVSREEEQERPEGLQAVLGQLRRDGPDAKSEEPGREAQAAAAPDDDELMRDLQGFEPRRANAKRTAPPGEPWSGARKLRQQQHLEHQLLQRRYEELAESRRQAEEARRAAAEEERLADMASDLLLQYLLKDGEEEEEEEEGGGRQGAGAREDSEEAPGKGSSLLFEDEEGNVAEDKRSNEAPEGGQDGADEDDIDPGTIDRLIELSSKLHLPADDVIDIINDVEKKKKAVPEPSKKSKALPAPPPPPPAWKDAPRHRPQPWPLQKPRRPHLPKQDQAAWNEVLPGDQYPARAKWAPAKPGQQLSNYISPRTFQPLAAHRFRHLPGPAKPPRGRYYDHSQAPDRARDEELDNYIERVLMERPKVFQ